MYIDLDIVYYYLHVCGMPSSRIRVADVLSLKLLISRFDTDIFVGYMAFFAGIWFRFIRGKYCR